MILDVQDWKRMSYRADHLDVFRNKSITYEPKDRPTDQWRDVRLYGKLDAHSYKFNREDAFKNGSPRGKNKTQHKTRCLWMRQNGVAQERDTRANSRFHKRKLLNMHV